MQADPRFFWLHIPHCWKSHVAAQLKKDFTYAINANLSRWFVLFFSDIFELSETLERCD